MQSSPSTILIARAKAKNAVADAGKDKDEKKPIHFAHYIAIKSRDTGKEFIPGIAALPTSSAVILYNPLTKVTGKGPTKDAMIETVETLRPPQEAKPRDSSSATAPSSTTTPALASAPTPAIAENAGGNKP
jgi:hypothetical protein